MVLDPMLICFYNLSVYNTMIATADYDNMSDSMLYAGSKGLVLDSMVSFCCKGFI